MANYVTETNGKDEPEEPKEARKADQEEGRRSISGGFADRVGDLLDQGDSLIYAIVGICFVLGALFALGYSFWDFGVLLFSIPADNTTSYIATSIIQLISNLLLVLIIMEVLGTITEYIKTHANSVSPFLFIGIISATRGILSIGARLSVEQVNQDEFYRSMIELGVNAGAILALGITLRLLGRTKDRDED